MTEATARPGELNRYDFVFLFDVQDGNPNGDPDAGNLPRIDPETGHGLVTDVCLKRKMRNWVLAAQQERPGYRIYVREKGVLNELHQEAYAALGLTSEREKSRDSDPALDDKKRPKARGEKKQARDEVADARRWMCQTFFDVRTFGAVMTTGANCGQVRGPVQLTFARSVEPITSLEHAITRVAITRVEDRDRKESEMGRKSTVAYGLYRAHGFVVPAFASQTAFSREDLELVWQSLEQMFELDRSATRGLMGARKLVVFEHDNALGRAPAHALFDRVTVSRNDPSRVARGFDAYTVSIRREGLPEGITVRERL